MGTVSGLLQSGLASWCRPFCHDPLNGTLWNSALAHAPTVSWALHGSFSLGSSLVCRGRFSLARSALLKTGNSTGQLLNEAPRIAFVILPSSGKAFAQFEPCLAKYAGLYNASRSLIGLTWMTLLHPSMKSPSQSQAIGRK
jgi:hypothetical protein